MALPINSIPQIGKISRIIVDNLKEIFHTEDIYNFVNIKLCQTSQLRELYLHH